MLIAKTKEELERQLDTLNCLNSKSLGFVPTMGALHEGHFSLVKAAIDENDLVICSIFVNPTQFNNSSDLTNYPNTLEKDLEALENLDCDIAFIPEVKTMYPQDSVLTFNFNKLEEVMEGAHRPGHFNGVALVVSKFFNIIRPNRAYFGQKDLQQFAVISQLAKDLSFPIELVCCETVRESDGLAMSSRNLRLTDIERKEAPLLKQVLDDIKSNVDSYKDVEFALEQGIASIEDNGNFELEYLEIADFTTLQPIGKLEDHSKLAVCVAAHIGQVRLIDNIVIDVT